MEQFLIDNNVISSYFSGELPDKSLLFIGKVFDQIPNISVITQIQALSWISSDKRKENIVMSFVEEANILPLSEEVVLSCIKIRRSRKIKTPDTIIAATALVHDYILITYDSDFKNLSGLKILNPKKINQRIGFQEIFNVTMFAVNFFFDHLTKLLNPKIF